jgi:ankyrin repeat protein
VCADVNKADNVGRTPLWWAAENGHEAVVKVLIAAGADVNKSDNYGRTLLYWAVRYGHEAVVKMLIAAGADVNKADIYDTRVGCQQSHQHGRNIFERQVF